MNEQKIFGNVSPEEREKLLEAHAVRKERTTFTQSLSDDELQINSAQYIRGAIDVQRLKDELKELVDQKKDKIKEQEEALQKGLEVIKNGRKQVVGVLYAIPNMAEGKMYLYNKHGELIEQRPLEPTEKQARAFIEGPTGLQSNPDEPKGQNDSNITDIDHEEVNEKPVEAQIQDLYAGPQIAGMADGTQTSNTSEAAGTTDNQAAADTGVQTSGVEGESGTANFSSGEGSGEENGKNWDDPSQVRNPEIGAKETEDGLKKTRTRKKKE